MNLACPFCQGDAAADARFCRTCGHWLITRQARSEVEDRTTSSEGGSKSTNEPTVPRLAVWAVALCIPVAASVLVPTILHWPFRTSASIADCERDIVYCTTSQKQSYFQMLAIGEKRSFPNVGIVGSVKSISGNTLEVAHETLDVGHYAGKAWSVRSGAAIFPQAVVSVSIAGYIGGQGGRLSAIHVGTVIFVGGRSVGADLIAQVVVPIPKVSLMCTQMMLFETLWTLLAPWAACSPVKEAQPERFWTK